MANNEILQVRGLHSGYAGRDVISDVSFSLRRGDVLSVVGVNGVGKTTLLNTIMGLVRPAQGSVVFNGVDTTVKSTLEISKLGIGYVPNDRGLFASMSVQENLELGANGQHLLRIDSELAERVSALFPILFDRLDQLAGTLSGGEQQMLSIGRCLMSKPKLLLLDEPFVGLSPEPIGRIIEALNSLSLERVAILISEQLVTQREDVDGRSLILNDGQLHSL